MHTPSGGKCWVGGVTYSIRCERSPCNNEHVPTPTYVGESCRSGYKRGSEHFALYKNKAKGSFIWKHNLATHEGVFGDDGGRKDFSMRRIATYKKCLLRILEEAVLIQEIDGDEKVECLNSKDEYFGAEFIRPCFPKGPAQQF